VVKWVVTKWKIFSLEESICFCYDDQRIEEKDRHTFILFSFVYLFICLFYFFYVVFVKLLKSTLTHNKENGSCCVPSHQHHHLPLFSSSVSQSLYLCVVECRAGHRFGSVSGSNLRTGRTDGWHIQNHIEPVSYSVFGFSVWLGSGSVYAVFYHF
jgi:hypothetical protein